MRRPQFAPAAAGRIISDMTRRPAVAGEVDLSRPSQYEAYPNAIAARFPAAVRERAMKIRNSLKSLRGRHRDNRLVRRKGRVYIINKTNRRFKARQG